MENGPAMGSDRTMNAYQRRPTRYAPDRNTTAWIHFGAVPEDQKGLTAALVVDVSLRGCKLVVVNFRPEHEDVVAHLAFGDGPFERGRMRWSRMVEQGIWILGFERE